MTALIEKNYSPFENFIKEFFGENQLATPTEMEAKTNVKELDDRYQLEVSLAGFKKDDIDINVDDGVLSISSDVENKNEDKDDNYIRYEFRKSSFKKQFRIPDDVNSDQIKAKFEDGILKVDLMKENTKISKNKQIKIE